MADVPHTARRRAIAHHTRYLERDLGPFASSNCIARCDLHRRITATVIPGSSQSNRDRAELVALRGLGTVEDCAKIVEFLTTDLSDNVTGAVIPIDGGWSGRASHPLSRGSSIPVRLLSGNRTFLQSRLLPMPMKLNGVAR